MPEPCSIFAYSAIIEEFFTISHILAEFFSQSRSDTVLAKDGLLMDKTYKQKGRFNFLLLLWNGECPIPNRHPPHQTIWRWGFTNFSSNTSGSGTGQVWFCNPIPEYRSHPEISSNKQVQSWSHVFVKWGNDEVYVQSTSSNVELNKCCY